MSEPIQLEWEPAEWPEKQPKWAGRQRGVRLSGASRMVRAMGVGDVHRVTVPASVHPQTVISRLSAAAFDVSAKIEVRQIGEHIYVRRVE